MTDDEVEQLIESIKRGNYDDDLMKDTSKRFIKLAEEGSITKEQHHSLNLAVLERKRALGENK